MKNLNLNPSILGICVLFTFHLSSMAQCGTCTLTQADLLAAPSGTYTIAAGQTLCITSNFCMGTSSNWPGSCANSNVGSLVINGTLKICTGITFKFAGAIVGTGKVEIMSAGRFSLFGTYDCSHGLVMTAIDPTITSGTSTSTTIGACNATSCEPHFSNGYAPLGIVAPGLGYNIVAGCAITGYPNDFTLLPSSLTAWKAGWQGKDIRLEWTISHPNNINFEVEYASDSRQWQDISDAIPVREETGTQTYSYTASGLWAETNFFRLKINGNDGSFTYSPVETVISASQPVNGIRISPNPVCSYFTLHYEGASAITSLRLIDMTGRGLLQLPYNPSGQYYLDKLVPGTYFLQVSLADGSRATRKITKL